MQYATVCNRSHAGGTPNMKRRRKPAAPPLPLMLAELWLASLRRDNQDGFGRQSGWMTRGSAAGRA